MKFLKNKFTKNDVLWHCLAFAVPCIAILIAFIIRGIAPFGDESLLSMDLWSQYFPMLTEQYNSRREFASALFSWSGGMGINVYAQNVYYCNSIFNWLLLLVPQRFLIQSLDYLILFKFGLAGFTMSLYLRYRTKRKNPDGFTMSPIITVCSVCYALCAWSLAFQNQIMWFDAFVFFPLIILGADRLLTEKKPLFYCFMLALTIYSSFYISFSICLFLIIYFVFRSLENFNQLTLKKFLGSAVRFGVFSLLAGALCAFTIIPVYKQISLTLASEIPAPEKAIFYNSVFDYLVKLLPETEISLEYGIPNIYTGGVVFLLLPLYFLNKKIPVLEKFLRGVLLMFLLLSMDLNVLDYVWHGFHFPNQLPGRWSFIFSFVLIEICARTFTNFKAYDAIKILISAGISISVIVLSYFLTEETVETTSLLVSFLFIVIYIIMFILVDMFKKEDFHRVILYILCLAIAIETSSNGIYSICSFTETGSIAKYTQFDEAMDEFTENYSCGTTDFYRTDIYENWTFDSPLLYNMNGTTYYSSTMSGSAYNFFKNMGMRIYAKNVSAIYIPYSPIVNSLFAVKYVANRNMISLPYGMSSVEDLGNVTVVENELCLPIAFVCDAGVKEWTADETASYLEIQNSFFNSITGIPDTLFQKCEWDSAESENANIQKSTRWQKSTYSRKSGSSACTFDYTFTVKEDGDYYLCNNFKKGTMTLNIDGRTTNPYTERVTHIALGNLKAGETVTVNLTVNNVATGYYGLDIYKLDTDTFQARYDDLKNEGMTVTYCKDGHIKGTITSDGGTVFTSIAQENDGFKVYVDGEQVETGLIADYLLTFDIEPGTHKIEIKYFTPGLKIGLVVSGVSVTALFVIILLRKRKFLQNL